jgi:hypothetical protein
MARAFRRPPNCVLAQWQVHTARQNRLSRQFFATRKPPLRGAPQAFGSKISLVQGWRWRKAVPCIREPVTETNAVRRIILLKTPAKPTLVPYLRAHLVCANPRPIVRRDDF